MNEIIHFKWKLKNGIQQLGRKRLTRVVLLNFTFSADWVHFLFQTHLGESRPTVTSPSDYVPCWFFDLSACRCNTIWEITVFVPGKPTCCEGFILEKVMYYATNGLLRRRYRKIIMIKFCAPCIFSWVDLFNYQALWCIFYDCTRCLTLQKANTISPPPRMNSLRAIAWCLK